MNDTATRIRAKNRAYWEASSDAYQRDHGPSLERDALAWGVWRIPEHEVRALGALEGRRVLELGCGAAQWTQALAAEGIDVLGIDVSLRQLMHARHTSRTRAARPRLVAADAAHLPFPGNLFDVVFCDHGAASFVDPDELVPEAARVLTAGGRLVFCTSTPFHDVCEEPATGAFTGTLARDYFDLGSFDDGACVTVQRPYGAWIRLFRRCGLAVDDLIELRPPADARTTYTDFVPLGWARRWPAEHIWKVRKEG